MENAGHAAGPTVRGGGAGDLRTNRARSIGRLFTRHQNFKVRVLDTSHNLQDSSSQMVSLPGYPHGDLEPVLVRPPHLRSIPHLLKASIGFLHWADARFEEEDFAFEIRNRAARPVACSCCLKRLIRLIRFSERISVLPR
jgi:hypothetical protein